MSINPFSSLLDLSTALAAGEYSALDLSRLYLERIDRANGRLHAFIEVSGASVERQAQASDLRRASGHSLGLLDGLPIAIKDLCEIEGQLTSCGSAAWNTRRSSVTAAVIERLRAAGMVILGKTHMVEFAFGGWGTNPLQGTPHNPWDLVEHRVPGGSSSGSGVAVAAGLAPAAIGSDTGGSVRIPASLVGITGLKTTSGLISLYGVAPLSPTLDTIGPMTRTVADAALLTQALAGPDTRDPATLRVPMANYGPAFLTQNDDISGMRIVVLNEEQFPVQVAADVLSAFRCAVQVLRDLGAIILERRFPFDFGDLMRRNGQIISAEAWSHLAHIVENDAAPVGADVRARVLSGKDISAQDYIEALAHHQKYREAWQEWMKDVDVLVTPTLPIVASRIDQIDEGATPLSTFTRAGNYLGACALTLPAGMSAESLPIGVQFMAKGFDEITLIRLGRSFQQATNWHLKTPDLSSLFSKTDCRNSPPTR